MEVLAWVAISEVRAPITEHSCDIDVRGGSLCPDPHHGNPAPCIDLRKPQTIVTRLDQYAIKLTVKA